MRKLFSVFLLIFSLLIINGKEYECEGKSNSFNEVERYILNEYEFINNGIKLEYTIKGDINSELERIFNVFKENGNFQIKKEKIISIQKIIILTMMLIFIIIMN